MKKLLVLFVISLLSHFCFAQAIADMENVRLGISMFRIVNGKFVCDEDDPSTYRILPMEGQTKQDLFHKMMLGLNKIYMDIDKVVTKIEYDAITINAYYSFGKVGSPFQRGDTMYMIEGFNYRLSFDFKDGKVRINAPIVTTFDYHHFLDLKKRNLKTEKFDKLGDDNDSGILLAVSKALNNIIISAYDSKKDDDW